MNQTNKAQSCNLLDVGEFHYFLCAALRNYEANEKSIENYNDFYLTILKGIVTFRAGFVIPIKLRQKFGYVENAQEAKKVCIEIINTLGQEYPRVTLLGDYDKMTSIIDKHRQQCIEEKCFQI